MTHIYFIGDLRAPFIKQNLSILGSLYDVSTFDLSKHATSFKQIPRYLISSLKETVTIIKSDVVWIWFADYPALPFIIIGRLFKKQIVTNVGGWEVYKAENIGYGNQLNPVRGACTRWIIRNSRVVVCPSRSYANITKAVEPQSVVIVIPGWIEPELLTHPLPEKHGVVTALCTRSFTDKLKGIPTFIAATQGMGAEIVVNIPRDELLDKFRHKKVYCQLSYTESFGMSLLESMACGCVPVTTDRDALPEVAGGCGVIVPYGDIEQTRAAIKLAEQMDSIAPRVVAAKYTKDRAQKAIVDLVNRLC